MPARVLAWFDVVEKENIYEPTGLHKINVFPNPTAGELQVTSNELQVTSIEIFDVSGKKLSSHPHIISSSHQKIDISHLNSGIYFMKIGTEQGETVKKIMKR